MSNIIGFNPCRYCIEQHRCKMCELQLYRDGVIKNSEWISVDDRLPEENGRYLVCVNVSHLAFTSLTIIVVMEYGKNHGFYLQNETETVTHWMPLPEAPKIKNTEI